MGTNCMTCALSDISNYNGYKWDEDFCLGLSGALSFWYSKEKYFIQATGVGNNIFDEFAAVTRVQHGVYETPNNLKAWKAAKSYIDHDMPIVLDVELMAYFDKIMKQSGNGKKIDTGLSKSFSIGGHVTCMSGYDDRHVYINENFMASTAKVPKSTFRRARNPLKIDFVPPNNRLHFFIFPKKLADIDHLIKTAVVRVIQNMENPFNKRPYLFNGLSYDGSGFFGMNEMFDDIEEIVKSGDDGQYKRLIILNAVLNRWGASEFSRAAYSRFLRQASELLGDLAYMEASNAYKECAIEWKAFLKELNRFCATPSTKWENLGKLRQAATNREKEALDKLHDITHY